MLYIPLKFSMLMFSTITPKSTSEDGAEIGVMVGEEVRPGMAIG